VIRVIAALATDLGFTTIRCVALCLATLVAIILAVVVSPNLWGFALGLAFTAGTAWNREIRCDGCHESLEDREA
jgi:hypothetical protein